MKKLFLISIIFSILFFMSSCKEKNYLESEYQIRYLHDFTKTPPKIVLYLYPRIVQTNEHSYGGYYVLTVDEVLEEMKKRGHMPADTSYFQGVKFLHGRYISIKKDTNGEYIKYKYSKKENWWNCSYYIAIKK